MKNVLILPLIVLLPLIHIYSDVVIKEDWNFESSKKVIFSIPDTCEVAVEFTDVIPPDFLVGYTCLSMQIDDSLKDLPDSVSALYRIRFDAGFLNFCHILTCTFRYDSGLFDSNVDISKIRCMQDPFPVSKFHYWRDCDSSFIDKQNHTFGFSYSIVRNGNSLEKKKNIKIASTGYPFDFGIVLDANSSVKNTCKKHYIEKPVAYKIVGKMRNRNNDADFSNVIYLLSGKSMLKSSVGAYSQYIYYSK